MKLNESVLCGLINNLLIIIFNKKHESAIKKKKRIHAKHEKNYFQFLIA